MIGIEQIKLMSCAGKQDFDSDDDDWEDDDSDNDEGDDDDKTSLVLSVSLQSSAVEQVLDILMDILSWEIAKVVSPCLPGGF